MDSQQQSKPVWRGHLGISQVPPQAPPKVPPKVPRSQRGVLSGAFFAGRTVPGVLCGVFSAGGRSATVLVAPKVPPKVPESRVRCGVADPAHYAGCSLRGVLCGGMKCHDLRGTEVLMIFQGRSFRRRSPVLCGAKCHAICGVADPAEGPAPCAGRTLQGVLWGASFAGWRPTPVAGRRLAGNGQYHAELDRRQAGSRASRNTAGTMCAPTALCRTPALAQLAQGCTRGQMSPARRQRGFIELGGGAGCGRPVGDLIGRLRPTRGRRVERQTSDEARSRGANRMS